VYSLGESANYINVTKITSRLENGTEITRDYPSVGIAPNSTQTFTFNWDWKEYRGKTIIITASLLQDFETAAFSATTPSPITVRVLNEAQAFDLKDKKHFNITLQNHPSSLKPINVTEIIVRVTGEVINGTNANPQLPYELMEPGQVGTFYCNITDWSGYAGGNLILTVNAVANETLEEYTFEFTFVLPAAELNVTSVIRTVAGTTRYLNVTVSNSVHSVWNLTISKVIVTFPNQTEPIEQVFPSNQIIVKPGDEAVLLCSFDWEKYADVSITVSVITAEGIEASQTI
jgi:hypothetical protein